MPHFDILKTYEASASFRAKSIVDLFTIEQGNLAERFSGVIDIDGRDWNVGRLWNGGTVLRLMNLRVSWTGGWRKPAARRSLKRCVSAAANLLPLPAITM